MCKHTNIQKYVSSTNLQMWKCPIPWLCKKKIISFFLFWAVYKKVIVYKKFKLMVCFQKILEWALEVELIWINQPGEPTFLFSAGSRP